MSRGRKLCPSVFCNMNGDDDDVVVLFPPLPGTGTVVVWFSVSCLTTPVTHQPRMGSLLHLKHQTQNPPPPKQMVVSIAARYSLICPYSLTTTILVGASGIPPSHVWPQTSLPCRLRISFGITAHTCPSLASLSGGVRFHGSQ